MAARRDRITLGIALVAAALAVIGRDYPWIAVPLTLFAMFLIVWGRAGQRTEEFVGRIPGGNYLLKGLRQLDLVLSPRDLKLEQHLRTVISGYDAEKRAILRQFWVTRNPYSVPYSYWTEFNHDGLVEHTSFGPGPLKSEMHESIGRVLDELRA
jgi:hypothetical protein